MGSRLHTCERFPRNRTWLTTVGVCSLLLSATCAETTPRPSQPAPAVERAETLDRTTYLHSQCNSASECLKGQACVPFSFTSDTEGETSLCEILCEKDVDCPQGYFCGQNAVNSTHALCYLRQQDSPKNQADAKVTSE